MCIRVQWYCKSYSNLRADVFGNSSTSSYHLVTIFFQLDVIGGPVVHSTPKFWPTGNRPDEKWATCHSKWHANETTRRQHRVLLTLAASILWAAVFGPQVSATQNHHDRPN